MFLAVCILLGFLPNQLVAAGPEWSYTGNNGPDKWSELYLTCGGSRQSPVDIVNPVIDPDLKKFIFQSYSTNEMTIKNNGENVVFELVSGDAKISGGGLQNEFKFVGFHLHWGKSGLGGSEHRLNGKQFSAELHFVHYDSTRFGSLGEALGDPQGVAVLGVFVEQGFFGNLEFQKLIPSLSNVNKSGQSTTFSKTIQLLNLLPPLSKSYYRYLGSLTTPPCSESVIWTVFKHPVYLSHEQLETLRSLNGEHEQMEYNWRPVQPLNYRKISCYEEPLIDIQIGR